MATITCRSCGATVIGAAQRRFCRPCRNARYLRRVRYLAAGEQVPDDHPRRYPASHGYIRLRWKVGPYEYVETYEHRVVDGRIVTEEHVHHLNRDRADNRPENLERLSATEHYSVHSDIAWHLEASRLYELGLSTYQVAERLGRHPATVYRALVKRGVALRKEKRVAIPNREKR